MRTLALLCLTALLGGCGPKTFEDCKLEAAKNPSDRGVSVAVQACYDKFEAPRIKAEAEAARKRAETVESAWASVQRHEQTIADVKKRIGEPDSSVPAECTPLEGRKPPGLCTLHSWKDSRVPNACAREVNFDCRWQMQTTPDGKIWATWDAPF